MQIEAGSSAQHRLLLEVGEAPVQKWVLGSAFFFFSPVIHQEPFLLGVFFLRVYILSVSRETWKQLTFGKSITRDWG